MEWSVLPCRLLTICALLVHSIFGCGSHQACTCAGHDHVAASAQLSQTSEHAGHQHAHHHRHGAANRSHHDHAHGGTQVADHDESVTHFVAGCACCESASGDGEPPHCPRDAVARGASPDVRSVDTDQPSLPLVRLFDRPLSSQDFLNARLVAARCHGDLTASGTASRCALLCVWRI